MAQAIEAFDHAARMDAIYRGQRHIYDLTRKYYLLGRDRLIEELDCQPGQAVLEVGCGTGRNLVKIARRWPGASLHGLDISAEMLASARASLTRAGLGESARLVRGDATGFDPLFLFGRKDFDRIVFSFTLSMIPGWKEALEQACACLAPGGRILVVDFGAQERLPRAFARALHAWLRRFHVTPRGELTATIDALAAEHGLVARSRSLYRGYSLLCRLG